MIKISLPSFIFTFIISLFIYVFIYFWGDWVHGYYYSYHFFQNGGNFPVFWEHVHTGRFHTRIDYRIFKKSSVMSFQWRKNKNLKLVKSNISTIVKINKHDKYTVTKRYSEKKPSCFKNWSKSLNNKWKRSIFSNVAGKDGDLTGIFATFLTKVWVSKSKLN